MVVWSIIVQIAQHNLNGTKKKLNVFELYFCESQWIIVVYLYELTINIEVYCCFLLYSENKCFWIWMNAYSL